MLYCDDSVTHTALHSALHITLHTALQTALHTTLHTSLYTALQINFEQVIRHYMSAKNLYRTG